MAVFTSQYLYLLDQTGGSDNAKVVRELVPNSLGVSTEAIDNGILMFPEEFTTTFIDDPGVGTQFGTTFIYIGVDAAFPGSIVATDANGNFYLFSNDGTIEPGEKLTGIVDEGISICFLAGTMIRCPGGERAVETLAIDDLILTMDGHAVPLKWIGRQTSFPMFGMTEGRRPVCITAGALGDDLPVRDLRLTADHALLIDNVLVQAGALVNGTTVRRIPPSELGERFVVYHIETENHEVGRAEGAPAETFIDNVSRRCFDNYAEFESLYGDETPIVELDQPRAMSARQVPRAIRERLATVARQLTPAVEAAA